MESNVVKLTGPLAKYRKEVREYGQVMFGEDWQLERDTGPEQPIMAYRIMVYVDGRPQPLSEPLALTDFILFWDGFRLCADEMRA